MADNSKIFIGARSLTDDEVEKIVPTYKNIQNSIEKFRAVALEENKENKNEFYHNNYNNTITILGKRGSGKTSVMLTLLESLKKDENNSEYKDRKCKGNPNNYIVGFIKPDDLNHSTTIQGCIIDHFEAVKEKIIEQYTDWEKWNNKCLDDNVEKLRKSYKDLLKSYIFTDPAYKDAIVNNYSDLNSYIDKSSFLLNSEANVEKKFMIFMNDLSNVHKKNNESIEPLFFIFFDDVDINTTKCRNIIDAILKYTSHPNIVVVVSGDYKTFLESLTHSMLIDEKINTINIDPLKEYPYFEGLMRDSESSSKSLYDAKRDLANDYLKKLFPPAYRNYVINWSLVQRANYSFGKNIDKTLITMIYDKLGNFISDDNNNNLSMFGYLEKNDAKVDNQNNKFIIFERSFELFDNTSRGLVNAYYTLSCIKEEEMKSDKRSLSVVKNLIESIVHSNTDLKDYVDVIFRNMIIFGKEWKDSKIVLNSIVSDESLSDERIRFRLLLLCNFALENFMFDKKSYNEIKNEIFEIGLNKFIAHDKHFLNREHINLWNEIGYNIKPFNNYNYSNLIYLRMADYYNGKANFVLNDFKEYNYSLNFHRIMFQCFVDLNKKGFSIEYDNYYFQESIVNGSLKNTRDNIIKNMNIEKNFNRKDKSFIGDVCNKIIEFYKFKLNSDINLNNYTDLVYVIDYYISLIKDELSTQDSANIESKYKIFLDSFYYYISREKFSKYESQVETVLQSKLTPKDFLTVYNSDRKAICEKISLRTVTKINSCKNIIIKALLINESHIEDFIRYDLDDFELDDEIEENVFEEHLVLFCYYGIFDCLEYKKEYSLFKEAYKKFSNNILNSK